MSNADIRIIVQQPALRKYRLPFFREWAGREGVLLKLLYAVRTDDSSIEVEDGFESECVPMWARAAGHRKLMWHSAQWKSARRGECDVLVLSWNVQYLSLIPALLRARSNGIKTILWGHGFSKNESAVRKFFRDAVGRMAHTLVFYDFETARQFRAKGWPERKIHVAPNSLDQDEIQQARTLWLDQPDRLHSFRLSRGLEGRKNIIYIGRIYAENRLDILIRALHGIRDRHPDVQLLMIGRINDAAEKLREMAQALGVSDAIQWLGEIYGEHEIAPYMLSSQVFCYPANIGLSIMHAMGYGVPVVTGDHMPGHNPEIHVLKEGENGCLFKHLDAEDLAGRVSGLLDDTERATAMGSAARDAVLGKFTTQKMVDGFMAAVKAVQAG